VDSIDRLHNRKSFGNENREQKIFEIPDELEDVFVDYPPETMVSPVLQQS
jgi:hypothetical protein